MLRRFKNISFNMGISPKLIVCFLSLSIVPMVILGFIADKNLAKTGSESMLMAKDMGEKTLAAASEIGRKAIEDSVRELDSKSTESIELRTVETAQRIADFLHQRDQDILVLASSVPDPRRYLNIYKACRREVIEPGPWPRNDTRKTTSFVLWENVENSTSWRHRLPDRFRKVSVPIYKEITFIDLTGQEKIKVREGRISSNLVDVSLKQNTYCKAEEYFPSLEKLERGEIYVSSVIGAHRKGWLYKSEQGIKVRPESAHAGKENPYGKRFEGIIRWATPVYEENRKTGYVTTALDHIHVMEFTDHIVPTRERSSDISDAGSGNYAFLWDYKDRCISHPRDFFICGYDPETGKEVPGWISQEVYEDFKRSGVSLSDFVENLRPFQKFSLNKTGSREQLESGCISLDCRKLDTAPQCQGWHRGTEDGGSGSFLILWSGLWKLTTYAAIPYHTGMYGRSKRGFGYVTIGAHVQDFHRAANKTKTTIEKSIRHQGENIRIATFKTRNLIESSSFENRRLMITITILTAFAVICASVIIGVTITRPLRRLKEGAEAISRGELHQRIHVKAHDEIGHVAESFNKMAIAVEEVDRMKSEFVSTVSHELRTPIHAMLLGVSGILEGYSGDISEEAREDLTIVSDGIGRLTRLIDNFLDLSRIESHNIKFEIVRTSIDQIVEDALEEVSTLIIMHRHTVRRDLEEGLPDIYVDHDRMIQTFVNLLSNAIKYTPDGGIILLKAKREGKNVVVSIADNGYGIPVSAQGRVFDKFFQADSIMSQKVGGSGLGLTISKGILREHGGDIDVKSPLEKGTFEDFPLGGERKGTIFRICLPTEAVEKRGVF